MKTQCIPSRSLILMASSLFLLLSTNPVTAAGPVAVAPGKNKKMSVEPPAAPVTFTIDLGAGYLSGESTEMVYWPSLGNHKASELTWKIDNLYMVGLGASMRFKERLAVNLSGWFKAFDGEGSMDDYDWAVPGGDWTDWSHHENTDVTEGSMLDLNVEFSLVKTDTVALKSIIGYKRDTFGWEAYGGKFIYSENGFRDTAGTFSDNLAVIGYEQTFTTVYVGMGVAAKFDAFELCGRLIYSPLVQGEATDNHYLRNLVTEDEGEDGDLVAIELAGSYFFTPKLALEMAYSYQRYDTMQGDSEWQYRNEGVTLIFDDAAGMDHTSSLTSLSLRYTF